MKNSYEQYDLVSMESYIVKIINKKIQSTIYKKISGIRLVSVKLLHVITLSTSIGPLQV